MALIYRILTYLLLPFALLFGVLTLIMFFIAITNPALFLGVFMLGAFCIYFFCSFRFLHQGILQQRVLKSTLRDWIKVNAYVSLPFAILNLIQSVAILSKSAMISEIVNQMLEMQQQMGVPAQPAGSYDKMILTILIIMAVFSVVLFVHIILSFSFLKKHEDLFQPAG
ncbi:MAG: hypothetical protein JWQ96_2527 [Segetibacter sp.]|nr:hypothetical protein [Segetibacter sp.]